MKNNITLPLPMFFALLFLLIVNLAITLVPKIVSAASVQDLLGILTRQGAIRGLIREELVLELLRPMQS